MKKPTRFKRVIINRTNPIETVADVKRASVAALSDEQVNDPMHSTLSEVVGASCSSEADIRMKIAKSVKKGLMIEKACRIYVERTQAEFQTQIKETLVDKEQLSNNAASNGITTAFWLL